MFQYPNVSTTDQIGDITTDWTCATPNVFVNATPPGEITDNAVQITLYADAAPYPPVTERTALRLRHSDSKIIRELIDLRHYLNTTREGTVESPGTAVIWMSELIKRIRATGDAIVHGDLFAHLFTDTIIVQLDHPGGHWDDNAEYARTANTIAQLGEHAGVVLQITGAPNFPHGAKRGQSAEVPQLIGDSVWFDDAVERYIITEQDGTHTYVALVHDDDADDPFDNDHDFPHTAIWEGGFVGDYSWEGDADVAYTVIGLENGEIERVQLRDEEPEVYNIGVGDNLYLVAVDAKLAEEALRSTGNNMEAADCAQRCAEVYDQWRSGSVLKAEVWTAGGYVETTGNLYGGPGDVDIRDIAGAGSKADVRTVSIDEQEDSGE